MYPGNQILLCHPLGLAGLNPNVRRPPPEGGQSLCLITKCSELEPGIRYQSVTSLKDLLLLQLRSVL